ncbi:cytochrome P450 [Aspergillus carlsbadensis]|nr:cytochrome P450 [Aspergillus carlsbadensis]
MTPTLLCLFLLASLALRGLCLVVYNVWFHPLRQFPGPWMAGATSWWRAYREVIKHQDLAQELFGLHERYGDVVRIAPNELHFGSPSAFHDIYHNSRRWDKDPRLYRTPGVSSGSVVFPKYAQAKERRDVLLPVFSRRSIKNLEHLIWRNATRLSSAITKANAANQSIDLLYAFRSFTLDTIMGFTIGSCINALDAPAFRDPLLPAMDASLRLMPLLKNFPTFRDLVFAIPPALVMRLVPNAARLAPRLYQVRTLIGRQLQAVLESPEKLDAASHQTIFHHMLDPRAYKRSGQQEQQQQLPDLTALHDEGFTLIFAGANTVADTLVQAHWHAMRNPALLARLREEVTAVWPDLDHNRDHPPLSLADLEKLPLLTATIKEALRFTPPGPSLTRVVPAGGARIGAHWVPGGTVVGMAIVHVHKATRIWGADAAEFRPERWLDMNNNDTSNTSSSKSPDANTASASAPALDPAVDLHHYLVAFSRGPRMCLGVNLAWAELYIALATMVRRFEIRVDRTTEEDMQWRDCIAAYYPRRHLHAWCRPVQ